MTSFHSREALQNQELHIENGDDEHKKEKLQEKQMKKTQIKDLPCEILLDIIFTLPMESLIRLKCTCKRLYTTISDPNFVEVHLHRAIRNPGYVYEFNFKEMHLHHNMCFVEKVGDNIEGMKIPYADLGRRSRYDSWLTICASTGGLMAYFKFIKSLYFICNPIIGEEVEVPMVPYDFYKKHSGPTWWGFGYSLSTKEYKLVHIGLPILHDDPKGIVWGVIYTLGSESWRVIPQVAFPPVYQGNVESDGTLFWLICKGLYKGGTENIGSFDVRSEKFWAWQGPLVDLNINEAYYYLVKLGDNIAFVRNNYGLNHRIWVLRNKENELWINEYNLISFMPSSSFREDFQVICLWMNGELLAITEYIKTCISYDAKKMEFKEVTLPNFEENPHRNPKRLHFVISHAGSLISPGRIMEMGKKFSIDKE